METELNLQKCPESVIDNLPENMEVRGMLDLRDCQSLESLPEGLKVGGKLDLWYCESLQSLPRGLKVGGELNIEHCYRLKSISDDLEVRKEIWIDPNAFCGTGVRKEDFPERLWKQIKYRF